MKQNLRQYLDLDYQPIKILCKHITYKLYTCLCKTIYTYIHARVNIKKEEEGETWGREKHDRETELCTQSEQCSQFQPKSSPCLN